MKKQYQAGLAVQDAAFYIKRAADDELFNALLAHEYCYVLAPRQIGKSSLMDRTATRLSDKGVQCAIVDFQFIGIKEVKLEQWYFGLIKQVTRGLGLPDFKVEKFWIQNEMMSPMQRWTTFLREVVLTFIPEDVVIFVDEIDSIKSLPFSSDDFFASVRNAYDSRERDSAFKRLTFCLLGVAAPNDLIQEPTRTPFNAGRPIDMEDFTWEQTLKLAPGLDDVGGDPEKLLHAVFDWTDGHPYMTQKICQNLVLRNSGGNMPEGERVNRLVEQIFKKGGRVDDSNLRYAETRFDKALTPLTKSKVLQVYRRLLNGTHVQIQSDDPIQSELRLTGMAAERRDNGSRYLKVRNKIFATVYDKEWVKRKEGDRAITDAIAKWVDSNKHDDYVLRGQALEDALAWALTREYITPDEREFLDAGRRVEFKEKYVQKEVEAERLREQTQRLTAERLRADADRLRETAEKDREMERQRAEDQAKNSRRLRRLATALGIAALALFVFMGITFSYYVKFKQVAKVNEQTANQLQLALDERDRMGRGVDELTENTERLKNETNQLKHEKQQLRAARDAAQKESAAAIQERQRIDKQLSDARNDIAAAKSAEKRAADAEARSNDANSKLIAANSKLSDVEKQNSEAAEELKRTRYDLETAQEQLNKLETRKQELDKQEQDIIQREEKVKSLETSLENLKRQTQKDVDQIIAGAQEALSRQLVNQADDIRVGEPDEYALDVLLAAEAVKRLPSSTKAIESLRNSVELLPSPPLTSPSYNNYVKSVAIGSGNIYLASTGDDNRIPIYEPRSQAPINEITSKDPVIAVASSPDGKYLAKLTKSRLYVWPFDEFRTIASAVTILYSKNPGSELSAISFSPNSKYLVAISRDEAPKIWMASNGNEVRPRQGLPRVSGSAKSVAVSADGRFVAVAINRVVRIFSVTDGSESAPIRHQSPVSSIAFSKNGELAIVGEDGYGRIVDLQSRRDLLPNYFKHSDIIEAVTFSPNGEYIATASQDNTARIWDVKTGKELLRMPYKHTVYAVAFSPDGKYLATGDKESKVRIWNVGQALQDKLRFATLSAGQLLDAACERLPRERRTLTHGEWKKYSLPGEPQPTCEDKQ